MLEGQKERQGDFVFVGQQQGDYEFCFSNEQSTYAEKMVDFEIAVCVSDEQVCATPRSWSFANNRHPQVENESRAALPSKQGADPTQTSALEESLFKISGQLSTVTRNQKYFRTRENRNFATVTSTEKRIVNFSLVQCCLIAAMGALQVFVVKFFFQGARKGYV